MSITFHVLEQGYIEAEAAPFLTSAGEPVAVSAIWPVRCYLIRHPAGDLLWDTGLPEEPLLDDPSALGGMRKHISNRIEPWLNQFGLTNLAMPLVGLSHMHIDHGGNINQFKNARFLIAEPEYRHAMSADRTGPLFYLPGYSEMTLGRVQFTTDVTDVFGDGSVVIYPAPGHSPGHQALFVSIPGEQPVLLVGDACYSPADLIDRRAPLWNHDHAQAFRTLDNLLALAQRHDARIAIHHDPDAPL